MRRGFVPAVVLLAITLAACGDPSAKVESKATKGTTAAPDTATAQKLSSPEYEKAGPNPSISAKMVCSPEAREDIEGTLGVKETSVTRPTWVDHLYSCTYVYPTGRITVNVKELVSEATTTAYFEGLQKTYGGTAQPLVGLGQGAWILKNSDVIVRKDYKTLHVDVQGIPKTFGLSMTRSDVATNIAVSIMGCWIGA